jgi:hypothetical protein
MQSPEGQEFPSAGCYLEVIKNEKLISFGQCENLKIMILARSA